ncbi:AP-3 complex subunit beta [Tulasnella sp. JGI-2019a]|nr:AP-3 complex subunit beta [Tulasnella sp. JGI-2019a]
MAFNTLAENAERLSQRIQESLQERTRDFTRTAAASYLDAPDLDKPGELSKLLNSASDREKLEGLKRVIAMISKNRNVSAHFAQVVKNVASPNLEIRKLVYIYLLRYASSEPDLALLSINTFQKDLRDPNPLIRAMALRVLSGIPVSAIGSIVALGIKNSAADSSPYVRKAAALAIPKLYQLDSTHLPALMQTLSVLLKDRSALSIGCVAVAFNGVCPDRLELLHQHYRRLCKMLVDADEWGQIHLLDLLGRYARKMLRRPSNDNRPTDEVSQEDEDDENAKLDPDVDLLLQNAAPLLCSKNPAVVMAVARTFYYVGPPTEHHRIVEPLLRQLRVSKEVERVILDDLCLIASRSPELLRPYTSRFYIRAGDLSQAKITKIQILVFLLASDNAQTLLREFKDYVVDTDDALVSDAVWAIGRCAQVIPETADSCLNALTMLIRSSNEAAVAAAVIALKLLHQLQCTGSHSVASSKAVNVVSALAFHFDNIRSPQARACLLWMVGQYSRRPESAPALARAMPESLVRVEPWAPDILRKAVRTFKEQEPTVKLQTLTLAAKLFVIASSNDTIRQLAQYVFMLARYDLDYDLRDKGRFLTSLLRGVAGGIYNQEDNDDKEGAQEGVVLRAAQVEHVLFEGRVMPKDDERWSARFDTLGTASLITDQALPGDNLRTFPDWPDEGTDPSLRDTEDETPPAPFYTGTLPVRMAGIGNQALASRLRTPSVPSSPVVLTPGGGASPAGSVPKPGIVKSQFMDLDDFFKSGDEDEGDEDEEDEDENEETGSRSQYPGGQKPQAPWAATTASSSAPSAPRTPTIREEDQTITWRDNANSEGEGEEEEESEEEDDAFLRRG